jgi:predicted RNA-binding protein YlqC (UPF0109 family)
MVKMLIEFIVKQLVDKPELVGVTTTDEQDRQVVTITVGEKDRGKVIGKDGQTVRALRTLATVASHSSGKEIVVDIASI